MKQYQVPQFINVEDKVVGPLTLKQFFFLLAGAVGGVIMYFALPFWLFVIVIIPVGILFTSLAFVKVNGQPFSKILSSAMNFYTKPRLFVWKNLPKETKKIPESRAEPKIAVPKGNESRLSDLAWSLDIKEKTKQ